MSQVNRGMRRSCQFCRSRKIRCSGQDKCDACRERDIDCVYGREAMRGRPRGARSLSRERGKVGRQQPTQPVHGEVDTGSLSTALFPPSASESIGLSSSVSSTASGSVRNTPEVGLGSPSDKNVPSATMIPTTTLIIQDSVASALEAMFNQNYNRAAADRSNMNLYLKAISSHSNQIQAEEVSKAIESDADSTAAFSAGVMNYDAVLSLVTQELVEMLSVKFGTLGCHHLGDTGATFYTKALANDNAPSMMEEPAIPIPNPIQELDSHRILQLIDIWYALHPLSIIVSKTQLLQQYQSNTHDGLLLSLIISDALYIGDGKVISTQGHKFFHYSVSLLHSKLASRCSLATAQTLTLMGWREMCLAKVKRATCFLGFACRVIVKLMQSTTIGLHKINGIDVGAVEVELLRNMYWLILGLTLWLFMQLDAPFIGEMLPPQTMELPPVDETLSIVYKLDTSSGHITTAQRQTRMIRELWAYSSITLFVAQVYSLFPRSPSTATNNENASQWQTQAIHQLQILSDPGQDMLIICSRARKALIEGAKVITVERVPSSATRATILAAYHTAIVHLLFPKSEPSQTSFVETRFDYPLSPDALETWFDSTKALIELSTYFTAEDYAMGNEKAFYSTGTAASPGLSMAANMFVLGLDACARTLEVISMRMRSLTVGIGEKAMLLAYQDKLREVAKELHAIAKLDKLGMAKRIRLVKRHLKLLRLQLDEGSENSMADVQRGDGEEGGSLAHSSVGDSATYEDIDMLGAFGFMQIPQQNQLPQNIRQPYEHSESHNNLLAQPQYQSGPATVSSPDLHFLPYLQHQNRFEPLVSTPMSTIATGTSGQPLQHADLHMGSSNAWLNYGSGHHQQHNQPQQHQHHQLHHQRQQDRAATTPEFVGRINPMCEYLSTTEGAMQGPGNLNVGEGIERESGGIGTERTSGANLPQTALTAADETMSHMDCWGGIGDNSTRDGNL